MEKDLPPKLDRESLKQLATEQLVELIMEQAIAIEKLRTKVLELEQEIKKLKVSRDLDFHFIIETTITRNYPNPTN
ncbi:hypothetical protein [Nostoc sp.]